VSIPSISSDIRSKSTVITCEQQVYEDEEASSVKVHVGIKLVQQ